MNPYRTPPKREPQQPICASCGEVETDSMFCAGPRKRVNRMAERRRTKETARRFDAWIERMSE